VATSSTASTIVGPRARAGYVPRAVILLVLAGLAAFSIVSHSVPVELGFKALVIGLPCVLFGGGFVYLLLTENRRSASRVSLKAIARYAMGTVT
jgi:hypothetical protein